MKTVRTEDAVGMILGQDLTRISPGEFKGVAFKKGHINGRRTACSLYRYDQDQSGEYGGCM